MAKVYGVSMHIGAILFDVDGTLLDTTEFIFSAYEHTLGVLELPVPPRNQLSRSIGSPLEAIYKDLAGAEAERAIELHRAFQSDRVNTAPAFPGTTSVLSKLRNTGLAVGAVTSRSNRTSVGTLAAAASPTSWAPLCLRRTRPRSSRTRRRWRGPTNCSVSRMGWS